LVVEFQEFQQRNGEFKVHVPQIFEVTLREILFDKFDEENMRFSAKIELCERLLPVLEVDQLL
jgi:hypothetical protein